MKYSIDRIENNIVILENIETGLKKEISINELPIDIKEENIVIEDNNEYKIDKVEEQNRREKIINKFQRLKKK